MGIDVNDIPPDKPVLIAGATASGKSALALDIAEAGGGVILNADALQVFAGWRILTARPPDTDLARAPHHLYGHVPLNEDYSVGHWLRDLRPFLDGAERPIIVGGTGLYFRALTEGLVDIPATPYDVRAKADALRTKDLSGMISELDPDTARQIDLQNPMRVQRAWEVLRTTGRGLASWQADTPPPLLPLANAFALHLDADRDWLADRITRRFDLMLADGVLDEARALHSDWNPVSPSSKAIGAAELMAHLDGTLSLSQAREAAIVATRQYAKRQRTWFRARMGDWQRIALPA